MTELSIFRVSVKRKKLGDWEGPQLMVRVNEIVIQCFVSLLQSMSIVTPNYTSVPGRCDLYLRVDETILNDFLSLLTTGEVELRNETLEPFTHASFKNNIPDLLETCEKCYLRKLEKASCLKLWLIGNSYGCKNLEAQAFGYIRENFDAISHTESWCLIDKHRVKQLIQDMKNLQICSEQILRDAIVLWSSYDCGLRTDDKRELLKWFNLQVLHNSHTAPDLRPCEYCATKVCVGQTRNGQVILFEIIIKHGELCLEVIKGDLPKDIDKDCVFQYCSQCRCLYASTEKILWAWKNGIWKKLGKMPFSRMRHMVCHEHVEGKTFVMGGYKSNGLRKTPIIHTYIRTRNKWSSQENKLSCNLSRGHCVSVGSVVYMFGNTMKDERDDVCQNRMLQSYKAADGSSQMLSPPPLDKDASVERVVASREGLVYVLTNRRGVLQYNPHTDSYSRLPSLPAQRIKFGAVVEDKTMFVFGGQEDLKSTSMIQMNNYCLDLREQNAKWKQCGVLQQSMKILS